MNSTPPPHPRPSALMQESAPAAAPKAAPAAPTPPPPSAPAAAQGAAPAGPARERVPFLPLKPHPSPRPLLALAMRIHCIHCVPSSNHRPSSPLPFTPFPLPSLGLISLWGRCTGGWKMTRMRKRVAERLKGAQNTYAMLSTFNEVDMTNLIAMRNKYKVRPFPRPGGRQHNTVSNAERRSGGPSSRAC